MESPLLTSYFYEKLFIAFLKELGHKSLKISIIGVFKHGRPAIIHLCSRIKTPEGITELIKLIDREHDLVWYSDSERNNIMHYAVYNRNLPLVEALLERHNPQASFGQNERLCNPMHLAAAAKHLNQLELPKLEEMLLSKDKLGQMLIQ